MYSFLVDDSSEHEKTKDMNKNAVETIGHSDTKMLCSIKNVWDLQWIKLKAQIMEYEPMKSTKFLYHVFDDKMHILNGWWKIPYLKTSTIILQK